jgi:hypothetical protein
VVEPVEPEPVEAVPEVGEPVFEAVLKRARRGCVAGSCDGART